MSDDEAEKEEKRFCKECGREKEMFKWVGTEKQKKEVLVGLAIGGILAVLLLGLVFGALAGEDIGKAEQKRADCNSVCTERVGPSGVVTFDQSTGICTCAQPHVERPWFVQVTLK